MAELKNNGRFTLEKAQRSPFSGKCSRTPTLRQACLTPTRTPSTEPPACLYSLLTGKGVLAAPPTLQVPGSSLSRHSATSPALSSFGGLGMWAWGSLVGPGQQPVRPCEAHLGTPPSFLDLPLLPL